MSFELFSLKCTTVLWPYWIGIHCGTNVLHSFTVLSFSNVKRTQKTLKANKKKIIFSGFWGRGNFWRICQDVLQVFCWCCTSATEAKMILQQFSGKSIINYVRYLQNFPQEWEHIHSFSVKQNRKVSCKFLPIFHLDF